MATHSPSPQSVLPALSGRLAPDNALLLRWVLRPVAEVLTYSLLSILLLRHLEGFLFAGIDVAFPDAQPSLDVLGLCCVSALCSVQGVVALLRVFPDNRVSVIKNKQKQIQV